MSRPVLDAATVWRRYDAVEARLTAHLSERMLDLAGLVPGAATGRRVLDLAAGRGEPALRAARRVGPTGYVLATDPVDGVLDLARAHATELPQLELRAQAAEELDEPPSFDAATIRWGLMYMRDPVEVLVRTRRALRPGAPLVTALWAEPDRVPYFTMPRQLLARYTAVPAIDPEAPGTFRYGDLARIERDHAAAGLRVTHVEELDLPVFETESGAELMEWCRAFGLTRLLEPLSEAIQEAWERDLVAAAEGLRKDGMIQIGGVTRVVVAKAAP